MGPALRSKSKGSRYRVCPSCQYVERADLSAFKSLKTAQQRRRLKNKKALVEELKIVMGGMSKTEISKFLEVTERQAWESYLRPLENEGKIVCTRYKRDRGGIQRL